MPWTPRRLGRALPSPTWQPDPPLPATLALVPPSAVVIDVGAGGRQILPGAITIDQAPFAGTRMCCDAAALALRDACADAVFTTGTFEHLGRPGAALDEIRRALKPGGILHIEVPFIFPFHPDPLDHTRWTLDGLRRLCADAGFAELRSGAHLGPASALNMVLIEYAMCYWENRWVRRAIYQVLSLVLSPHRYLDRFLLRRRYAQNLACGVYFVGRKRA